MNSAASIGSELVSYALSGVILDKIGFKLSYFLSFSVVVLGSLFYIIVSYCVDETINTYLIPGLLLLTSFGISSALNSSWNGNSVMFPVIYAASTNGISNFFARSSTILSPQIAEMK